jgi:hypothetical protein
MVITFAKRKKNWLYNTCYTEFCPKKMQKGQKGEKKWRRRVEKRREERKERCAAALAMAILCCELAICRQF